MDHSITFSLPTGKSGKLALDEIFEIVASEVGLDVLGDGGKNLINAVEVIWTSL